MGRKSHCFSNQTLLAALFCCSGETKNTKMKFTAVQALYWFYAYLNTVAKSDSRLQNAKRNNKLQLRK